MEYEFDEAMKGRMRASPLIQKKEDKTKDEFTRASDKKKKEEEEKKKKEEEEERKKKEEEEKKPTMYDLPPNQKEMRGWCLKDMPLM